MAESNSDSIKNAKKSSNLKMLYPGFSHADRERTNQKKFKLIKEKTEKLNEPKFLSFLRFGGLISTGIKRNVKLDEDEERELQKNRRHSRLLVWFFLGYAVHQSLLMVVQDPLLQLWLGDMTPHWPGNRINFLILSFLLSIYSTSCCFLFQNNERKLNWYLPFFSLKQAVSQSPFASTPTAKYDKRMDMLHDIICFVAGFATGLYCLAAITTAWFKYPAYIFILSLPWYVA